MAMLDSLESRKRKGVPLPYLIRPRRKQPLYDTFSLYNDYVENSSIKSDESNEDDIPMEAVETPSLEKSNFFGIQNERNARMEHLIYDEKDDEYVLVRISKEAKEGAMQMMELSKDLQVSPLASDGVSEKDTIDAIESEDAGSNSDDWVVV